MISSASNGLSSCLWNDEGTIKFPVEYPTSMESCDMQDTNSTSVKAAPPMISGALNGPSGHFWYDEGTTKLLVEYPTSLESCDMQGSNSISYTVYV